MSDNLQIVEINMRLSNIERMLERIVMPDKWLSIKEAAEYAGSSKSTLRRAIQKGTLKRNKNRKGKILFRRSEIDRFLDG